jgi:hypothetical protein
MWDPGKAPTLADFSHRADGDPGCFTTLPRTERACRPYGYTAPPGGRLRAWVVKATPFQRVNVPSR